MLNGLYDLSLFVSLKHITHQSYIYTYHKLHTLTVYHWTVYIYICQLTLELCISQTTVQMHLYQHWTNCAFIHILRCHSIKLDQGYQADGHIVYFSIWTLYQSSTVQDFTRKGDRAMAWIYMTYLSFTTVNWEWSLTRAQLLQDSPK